MSLSYAALHSLWMDAEVREHSTPSLLDAHGTVATPCSIATEQQQCLGMKNGRVQNQSSSKPFGSNGPDDPFGSRIDQHTAYVWFGNTLVGLCGLHGGLGSALLR